MWSFFSSTLSHFTSFRAPVFGTSCMEPDRPLEPQRQVRPTGLSAQHPGLPLKRQPPRASAADLIDVDKMDDSDASDVRACDF